MSLLEALTSFFSSIWDIFALQVPGFTITFQELLLGAFVAAAAISALKALLGLSHGGVSQRSGRSARKAGGDVDDV